MFLLGLLDIYPPGRRCNNCRRGVSRGERGRTGSVLRHEECAQVTDKPPNESGILLEGGVDREPERSGCGAAALGHISTCVETLYLEFVPDCRAPKRRRWRHYWLCAIEIVTRLSGLSSLEYSSRRATICHDSRQFRLIAARHDGAGVECADRRRAGH